MQHSHWKFYDQALIPISNAAHMLRVSLQNYGVEKCYPRSILYMWEQDGTQQFPPGYPGRNVPHAVFRQWCDDFAKSYTLERRERKARWEQMRNEGALKILGGA